MAWYLARSERLLDDIADRVQALRSRGGQLAGFSAAVLALAGANAGPMLREMSAAARLATGVALLAGSISLIAASVIALRGTSMPRVVSDISVREAANYTTDRFTHEPDLWRVQLRTINALVAAITETGHQGDVAARAVRWAGRCFRVGLVGVGVALGILVSMVAFR